MTPLYRSIAPFLSTVSSNIKYHLRFHTLLAYKLIKYKSTETNTPATSTTVSSTKIFFVLCALVPTFTELHEKLHKLPLWWEKSHSREHDFADNMNNPIAGFDVGAHDLGHGIA